MTQNKVLLKFCIIFLAFIFLLYFLWANEWLLESGSDNKRYTFGDKLHIYVYTIINRSNFWRNTIYFFFLFYNQWALSQTVPVSLQLPCFRLMSRLGPGQAVLAANIYYKSYLYNFWTVCDFSWDLPLAP